jgi:hypothetical protein
MEGHLLGLSFICRVLAYSFAQQKISKQTRPLTVNAFSGGVFRWHLVT